MSNQYELMTLFKDGGFMMYPLVLCSLIAFGVILAKAWTRSIAHRDSKRLLAEIEDLGVGGRLHQNIHRLGVNGM